ncbi:RHS repeat-associated core domain-containing protein [Flavobacterium columnare]|uniref:RHS repeat domain-containing protein n=1 Tax=Flavobacterium columnare TaxID=996 RepID=UPI0029392A31|nr:RHS repeat-associated core domain-containing protein [Flavobacterium columnare]
MHEWTYSKGQEAETSVNELGEVYLSQKEAINDLVTWVYQENSFVPSAKIQGEAQFSIISDYIGRPVQCYSENGSLVWSTDYDIYGGLRDLKGEKSFIPFRQLGQYEDLELEGLYYNRFRYYDCTIGNYISQDPLSLYGGNPTLYAYVGNSNRQIDPFGLSSFDPFEFGEITDFPKDLHFGQNRVAPNFSSIGSQASSSIAGRSISDVANDLSTGKLDPNEFIISYTKDPQSGKFVTLNNRGLAALSESGKFPNSSIYVPYEKVPKHLVADIKTRPPLKTIDVTLNKDGSGLLRTIKNCN